MKGSLDSLDSNFHRSRSHVFSTSRCSAHHGKRDRVLFTELSSDMHKVYFFVPNLVGYVRIVLNLSAFYFILHKPFLTVALHFTGGIFLDVADGVLARYLNQCSRYGDLLDFLLDRCTLMTWPNNNFKKKTCSYDPWLTRIFFQEPILTLVIFGQDMCVSMLYLLHFSPGPTVSVAGTSYSLWLLLANIGAPFLIYRQVVVCGLLLINSFSDVARLDQKDSRNDTKVE